MLVAVAIFTLALACAFALRLGKAIKRADQQQDALDQRDLSDLERRVCAARHIAGAK